MVSITSDQIQAASAVGTLIAAIASSMMIWEMRRQRSSQHRPELVIDDTTFRVHWRGGASMAAGVVIASGGKAPSAEQLAGSDCTLMIRNVGFGVARDIRLQWDFDVHAMIAQLAPMEEAIGGRIWLDDSRLECEELPAAGARNVRKDSRLKWMVFLHQTSRLGTLVPNGERGQASIELPLGYAQLLSLYILGLGRSMKQSEATAWDIPPLDLRLTYRDMAGSEYRKVVRVLPRMILLEGLGDDVPGTWRDVGAGVLEVNERD